MGVEKATGVLDVDKREMDSLIGYIGRNFPEEGMEISTGIDMLTAALERISEGLIIRAESLDGKGDPAVLNELEGRLDSIEDLILLLEEYSGRLDLSDERDEDE